MTFHCSWPEMFTTWKYDPKDSNAVFATQTRTFDPTTAKTIGHAACSSCRAQKLKCDGERSGCQRCKMQGRQCTYVDVPRHKKPSHAASKSQEHMETRKQSSSRASSTTSLLPAVPQQHQREQQQQQHELREEQDQQQQQQQSTATTTPEQQQTHQHEDLTWLMAQPPEIGFFAEFDLHEDLGGAADPTNTLLGITTPMLDDSSHAHPNHLPLASPMDTAEDGAEFLFKSHGSYPAACQCLYRIVMVMDQLDMQDDCALDESLNNLLVLHKDALSNSTKMLSCPPCTARIENMLVLAILLDKLARLCQRIVHVPGVSKRPLSVLSVGDYKVDSAEEYVALNCSLLRVQLRRLQALAQDLQHISLRFHSETLARRLAACAATVTTSLDSLRNVGGWT